MALSACDSSSHKSLLQRYLESCEKHGIVANADLQHSISAAEDSPSDFELRLNLEQLTEGDMMALTDMLSYLNNFRCHAVDVLHNREVLYGNSLLKVLRSVGMKLRTVDLRRAIFGRDLMRELLHKGMQCQHLNMSFSRYRKLDMIGQFPQLHTLILDFSVHLADFPEGCFRATPNLARVSMCETKVANLWTTCAALTKIPTLTELRFQSCKCCQGTGHCRSLTTNERSSLVITKLRDLEHSWSTDTNIVDIDDVVSIDSEASMSSNTDGLNDDNSFSDVDSTMEYYPVHSSSDESSMDSDDESGEQEIASVDDELNFRANMFDSLIEQDSTAINNILISRILANAGQESASLTSDTGFLNQQNALQVSPDNNHIMAVGSSDPTVPDIFSEKNGPDYLNNRQKFALLRRGGFHHPSLICSQQHYRDFMLACLPSLAVLDNVNVTKEEKEKACSVFTEHFENIASSQHKRHNIIEVLKGRETSSLAANPSFSNTKGSMSLFSKSFTRYMCSSKMSSCSWPSCAPLYNKEKKVLSQLSRKFKPRQFEYHPSDPALMVFGTLHGEVVVINHESDRIVGQVQSNGSSHSILGLCWLNKDPSKLIAGADNGGLQLYDIDRMRVLDFSVNTSEDGSMLCEGNSGRSRRNPVIQVYDKFEQLTSVHVNCSDEYFLVSGYCKNVGLYDLGTGKQLQVFKDLHQQHINVVKFAHHSPHVFATSSFDKDIKMWDLRQRLRVPLYTVNSLGGNVTVCFSRDDYYLLSSAVDNEVRQHLAVDGRLHLKFDIPSSGSSQNYTRSYYMNGRDYVISGSCEENVVRIYSAQTGRRLRDLALEGRGSKTSIYVQSLRGDPFRDFHFSVLAAYFHPHLKSEILKVNLLAGNIHKKSSEVDSQQKLPAGMGA